MIPTYRSTRWTGPHGETRTGRHTAGAVARKPRKLKRLYVMPNGMTIPWEHTIMAKQEREAAAARRVQPRNGHRTA